MTKKQIKPVREDLLHELLHGAFLTAAQLELVGRSGKNKTAPIFKNHPKLRKSYEKAVDACWNFYQELGKNL